MTETQIHSTPLTLGQPVEAWLRRGFAAAFPDAGLDLDEVQVIPPRNAEFGDFQCNRPMSLAKDLRMAPRSIAEAAIDAAGPHPAVEHVEVGGPGFINIRLRDEALVSFLSRMAADAGLGIPSVGEGKTVVMDYSSPNACKPMHIGHLRSMNIGSVVDRMFRALGYRVIADNHIGDWGTQFGILIMGYRHFLDESRLACRPVEELERLYVKSYERSKQDEAWLRQCREELVKLQRGDPDNLALWKTFIDLSLEEYERIYEQVGVHFDLVRGESYYNDRLPGVIEKLREHGLVAESEGAQVVFLEEEGLPVCIVQKSDGGYNYATTDLATVLSRVEEFDPERIVYFTDERQQLHFQQFFSVCRRMGIDTRLDHVWFGLMRLPDATFSTREGNVIKLEALFDDAVSRAHDIVRESSPDMPEDRQAEIARAVGVGAVKYADLSQNPQTLVTFTWEKAMALDGNSGPYLQYAYARISSVRDKYAERFPGVDPEAYPFLLGEPVERALASKLCRFPEVVVRAAHAYKPNQLCDYLYELAQTYSSFYQNVPFLKAEEGVREGRVRLCGVTAAVLERGLTLLGMGCPERI